MATLAIPVCRPTTTFSIKLKQAEKFNDDLEIEVVEYWLFQVENYFELRIIINKNIKTH